MRTHDAKLNNAEHSPAPAIKRESSQGGAATIKDNRPSTVYQRKLIEILKNRPKAISPIQRSEAKGSSKFRQIANNMGAAYGVDTSNLKATHNSSFPAKINAEATIQGNNIHFAPGKDTNYNIRHEVSHAIDNAINGTPKGDRIVNGQKVDTTREKVVDRMAIAPLKIGDGGAITGTKAFRIKHSPPSLPIQRAIETDHVAKNYDELMNMNVKELVNHTNKQADWHRHVTVPTERNKVRALLGFLRNKRGVDGTCEAFKSLDLWVKIQNTDGSAVDAGQGHKIMAYTRGVRKESAHCKKQTDVDQALSYGESILKLESKISMKLLAHIFTDKMFELLHNHLGKSNIDSFLNYYETCSPYLSANNGMEVFSYLVLKIDEAIDPVIYYKTSLKEPIRNYHRFEKAALEKLKENFDDTSKEKPLTLILHSQVDHNGAFFREKKLTELITKPELYVLMVEGVESLADAKTQINGLLDTHAQDGVIDQLMIAGHGETRSIGVAGDFSGQQEGIDLNKSADFLDYLLDKLANKIGDEMAVVVFNACLTNSNEVNVKTLGLTGEAAEDAQKIREYIHQNPNLASYIRHWSTAKGKEIKSIGASASTNAGVVYYDTRNRLTLQDAKDPKLTASKLEYVKEGIEPSGALRAALETWAADIGPKPALNAIKTRADKGDHSEWCEQLIRSLFASIHTNYHDYAEGIARLVTIATALKAFPAESNAQYERLRRFELDTPSYKDDVLYTIEKMSKTDQYEKISYIRLGLFQLQIKHREDKKNELLEHLGTFKYRMVKKYTFLEIDELDLDPLLPASDAKSPSHGQLLLALMAIKKERGKSFLLEHLDGSDSFPAKAKLEEVLDGYASENRVMMFIGKTEASGEDGKKANLQLEGDTTNKMYVTPMTRRGRVSHPVVIIRPKPMKKPGFLGELTKNQEVHILGKTAQWYAVEHEDKVGFVQQQYVTLIEA